MAAVLSFFVPGLGHLFNGRIFQGLLLLVITIAGYACFVVPGLIIHLFVILDAARDGGRRAEARMRQQARVMAEEMRRR